MHGRMTGSHPTTLLLIENDTASPTTTPTIVVASRTTAVVRHATVYCKTVPLQRSHRHDAPRGRTHGPGVGEDSRM